MGLRFDPSGGQLSGALKAIVEAERQPIKQLEARKGKEEARLKLFNDFKSKFTGFDATLRGLSDYNRFKEYKVDLGDGKDLIGVTVDKEKVQPGAYELEIQQLAQRSAIMTNGFEDPEKPILGTGYVVIHKANGEKEEVYVAGNDASLRGLEKAINRKSDGSIRASVVKDSSDPDAAWRLIITAKNEGIDDEIQFPEFYFLDGEQDLEVETDREALNAVVKVNGFPIETDGNRIADFFTGLSLEIKQAREGSPFTLTITEDVPKMAEKVKGMVDQINGILEFINKQNQVDDKSDTSASFAGDTSLQNIEFRLRNMFHEGFPVWDRADQDKPRFKFLNELGVSFEKNGALTFNAEKFTKALEKDMNGVSQAISGEHGFAAQLREVMANYTRPGNGLLAIRETGMRGRITRIDRDIEAKERILQRRQESLTAQFSRLQGTLASMQQQQSYLQSAMAGAGAGGGMISQLMGG